MKRNLIVFLLVCLFFVKCQDCNGDHNICQSFDPNIATYASKYAACSCILTQYKHFIQDWSYKHCQEAQDSTQISDLTIITDSPLYLLAFVVYDKERKLIVVSFRATVCGDNWRNAYTDLLYTKVRYRHDKDQKGCNVTKCQVHLGFKLSYDNLKEKVRSAVLSLANKHKNDGTNILVTGISYGAALAALGSYDLKVFLSLSGFNNIKFYVYTFGQPRLANKIFANEIDRRLQIFRLVNQADPFPHLPPRCKTSTADYFHPGHEIYIRKMTNFQNLQLKTCQGDSNGCSLNQYQDFTVCNHLQYPNINYNQIVSCCNVPSSPQGTDYIGRQDCKIEQHFLLEWTNKKLRQLIQKKHSNCSNPEFPSPLNCTNTNTNQNHQPSLKGILRKLSLLLQRRIQRNIQQEIQRINNQDNGYHPEDFYDYDEGEDDNNDQEEL